MQHRSQCTRVLTLVGVALACLSAPAAALADGDPASDWLTQQAAFVPPDAGFSATQQLQLQNTLADASRHGFPLRVAVIGSPSDLGSVAAAWRKPQAYAKFLAYELSQSYHGALLVVMPNGAGEHGLRGTWSRPVGGLPGATLDLVHGVAVAHGVPAGPVASSAPATRSKSVSLAALLTLILGALAVAGAWTASLRARPLRAPAAR